MVKRYGWHGFEICEIRGLCIVESVRRTRLSNEATKPCWTSSAPGKIILLGEHAVVYGRPAIAVPVTRVRAVAHVVPLPPGQGTWIDALDLKRRYALRGAPADDPLAHTVRTVWHAFGVEREPDIEIVVHSTIPIASGLGSGAAVATAIVRALAAFFGRHLSPDEVSALVYETEKLLHGTPSGIDNTVVAHERPIWFRRGEPPRPFTPGGRFDFLIADTGVPSPTRVTVADVRAAWQADPARYEALFDRIAALVEQARKALEQGDKGLLGTLMDENQEVLRELGVSSPEIEKLVKAAREAGALGAKLSGGGRGGNVIVLVETDRVPAVRSALQRAGAVGCVETVLAPEEEP